MNADPSGDGLALSSPGTRVVLVGMGQPSVPGLPAIPAAVPSVTDLAASLRSRCGVREESLRVLTDPANPQELSSALRAAAAEAEDVFLFHYVGHGLIDSEDELYLATAATHDLIKGGRPADQALQAREISQAIKATCRAGICIVVLDCCYSGNFDWLPNRSSLLLASAEPWALASASESSRHTLFTGTLIDLLEKGDDRSDQPRLTLRRITDLLEARLISTDWPPVVRYQGGAGRLVFAVNKAAEPKPADAPSVTRAGESDGGTGTTASAPASGREPPPDAGISPYVGLPAYDSDDKEWFFGRENDVSLLLQAAARSLRRGEPLVVSGASGVGKSSLLKAGLLPWIAERGLGEPGSSTWPAVVTTPGDDPLRALALSLAKAEALESCNRRRGNDVDQERLAALHTMLSDDDPAQALRQPVLLVIDQFEEVFTHGASTELPGFARAVGELAKTRQALIVISVRSDFYDQLLDHRDLAPESVRFIPPLDREQLLAVIERPARRAGLELEENLADVILHDLDVRARPKHHTAALPLLSHALLETWKRRDRHLLTITGYVRAGRVDGAIAKTADEVIDGLDDAGRSEVRRILVQLVNVEDTAVEPVRRVVAKKDLHVDGPGNAILNTLVDKRLLTIGPEEKDEPNAVQISHEALLEAWPTLSEWIEADREMLRIRDRLRRSAQEWEESSPRDSGLLYTGARLEGAESYARTARGLTSAEKEFLQASRRRQSQKERRLWQVITALSVLLVTVVMTGVFALKERDRADARSREAVVQQLLALADTHRDDSPKVALTFDLAALRLDPSHKNRENLVRGLLDNRYGGGVDVPMRWPHDYDSLRIAFSPDGRLLAAGDRSGPTVTLWRIAQRRLIREPVAQLDIGDDRLEALRFSSDGTLLTSGRTRPGAAAVHHTVRWDLTRPERPRREALVTNLDVAQLSPDGKFAVVWPGAGDQRVVRLHRRGVHDVGALTGGGVPIAFSQDGRMLLTRRGDRLAGSYVLWDLSDPDRLVRRSDFTIPPVSSSNEPTIDVADAEKAAFSPDGTLLALGGHRYSAAVLMDISDPVRPRYQGALADFATNAAASSLAFAPRGRVLVTGNLDAAVKVWDVSDPRRPRVSESLWVPANVTDVVFTPDGRRFVAGSLSKSLTLWNLDRPAAPTPLGRRKNVTSFGLSSDGRRMVTAQYEAAPSGRVRTWAALWDLTKPARPRELTRLPSAEGSCCDGVGISPDGRVMAVRAWEGPVTLWDVSDPTRARRLATLPSRKPAVFEEGSSDGMEPGRVLFSPDGRTLAVNEHVEGATDRTGFGLWDISRPARPRRHSEIPAARDTSSQFFVLSTALQTPAAFSPDGRVFAANEARGREGTGVTLWNLADPARPRRIGRLPNSRTVVHSLAFSPDGHRLAASDNGPTRLWDVRDPDRPEELKGISGYRPYALAFGQGHHVLLRAGLGRSIEILSAGSPAQEIRGPLLHGHFDVVTGLHLISDTGLLVTLDGAHALLLWDVDDLLPVVAQPEETVCALIEPGLSEQGWRSAVPNHPFIDVCPHRFARVCEQFGANRACWTEQPSLTAARAARGREAALPQAVGRLPAVVAAATAPPVPSAGVPRPTSQAPPGRTGPRH